MRIQTGSLRGLLVLSVLIATQAFSGHALAWDRYHRSGEPARPSRLRLLAGAHFGIAGELEPVDDDTVFGGPQDLATTYGGHFGVDAVIFRFFAMGGEARFSAFNTEDAEARNIDRSFLLEFDAKPRLRIPLARERMEFYFSTPLGLTIPILSDDINANGRIDGKPGFNLGIGGGFTFFITHRFGLNIEPMYVMRWFAVDRAGGGDVDLRMRQFTLFTNAVIAL
jgi:hypothetical protein